MSNINSKEMKHIHIAMKFPNIKARRRVNAIEQVPIQIAGKNIRITISKLTIYLQGKDITPFLYVLYVQPWTADK